MSASKKVTDGGQVLSPLQRGLRVFTRWMAPTASIAIAVFYLMYELGILDFLHKLSGKSGKVEEPTFLLPIALALLLELIREMYADQKRQSKMLEGVTRSLGLQKRQSKRLEGVIRNLSTRVLNLREVIEEVTQKVAVLSKRDKPVVVEHLALDMSGAWEDIERFLRSAHNVEYRLTMMDPTGSLDEAALFREWRQTSKKMIETIRTHLKENSEVLKSKDRRLDFKLQTYKPSPFVHGIAVKYDDKLELCMVAFCRWSPPPLNNRMDWQSYHRIVGEPEDDRLKNLAAIFDGYFNHYWRKDQQSLVDLSTKK